MTTYGANAYLEDVVAKSGMLALRGFIKLAVMQLLERLRLIQSSWDKTDRGSLLKLTRKHELSTPDRGGRVLMNGSMATSNQIPHLDYSFAKGHEVRNNNALNYPQYFALCLSLAKCELS